MQKHVVIFFFMVFVHVVTSENKDNSYGYHFEDYGLVKSNYSYFLSL